MADAWATPEDLRVHLRLAAIDEDQAAAVIAAAEQTVRDGLEQQIDPVAGDIVHLVGNGRTLLHLPERPVTAVTSVTSNGDVLEPGAWRHNRYGQLTRLDGCWPLDAEVTVVYDHGYVPIPATLRQTCIQVASRAWVNPSEGIAAESLGDRSVTYDKARTGQALTEWEQRTTARYARGNESR
ncbi:hypothetical protein [Streptomyces sp. NRRL F-5135]|uniref:hypothetical protein n=1 Tax=Streptomyces sp. NRRL F-5135 TaxID=1463858 RepID=UPI0004CAFBFC|nr:hypothetical protein [Streptomyces sp. NRRL F-5135]